MLHRHPTPTCLQLRDIRGNSKPMGGLQVIMCGDFFQLPPGGWMQRVRSGRGSMLSTHSAQVAGVSTQAHGRATYGPQCHNPRARSSEAGKLRERARCCRSLPPSTHSGRAVWGQTPKHGLLTVLPTSPSPSTVTKRWVAGTPPDHFLNCGFAFQAPAWRRCGFEHVLLTQVGAPGSAPLAVRPCGRAGMCACGCVGTWVCAVVVVVVGGGLCVLSKRALCPLRAQVFRQKDERFVRILDDVRYGRNTQVGGGPGALGQQLGS